jgi:hypothetical protein
VGWEDTHGQPDATTTGAAVKRSPIVNLLSRDWGVDAHADGGKSVWAEFSLL